MWPVSPVSVYNVMAKAPSSADPSKCSEVSSLDRPHSSLVRCWRSLSDGDFGSRVALLCVANTKKWSVKEVAIVS